MVNATTWPFYAQERGPASTVQEAVRATGQFWDGAVTLAPNDFRSPDRPQTVAVPTALFRPIYSIVAKIVKKE